MAETYRHRLTAEQQQMTDRELAATLAPGVGLTVARWLYWDVVARLGAKGELEYIVTDSSRPGQKPLKVHGPTTRQDALDWVRREALLFQSLRGGHIDDDIGGWY